MAKRLAHKYPELGSKTFHGSQADHAPWIMEISRGGLTIPSLEFVEQCHQFEKVFNEFHGSDLDREPNVLQRLTEKLSRTFPEVPHDLLSLFGQTRTFIKIKSLNRNLQLSELKQKRRNLKQIGQFVT